MINEAPIDAINVVNVAIDGALNGSLVVVPASDRLIVTESFGSP